MTSNLNLTGDYQAGDLAPRMKRLGMILAVLGLGAGAAMGAFGDAETKTHFWFAYLVAFCFALTIGMGAMFFVLIGHVVNAHWNVTLRRLAELTMSSVPVVCLFGLGMLIPFFDHDVEIWQWDTINGSEAHAVEHAAEGAGDHGAAAHSLSDTLDHEEHVHVVGKKKAYLNRNGFIIRLISYFLIWAGIARFFLKKSVEQDTAGDSIDNVLSMKKVGAPMIFVFALTLSFAAFDLIMSLDETWFSTIFGVYIFAGSFLAANCWLVIMSKWLQAKGKMADVINKEHYHDLGKWMFAFTFFWGYIAFSQFMLIWYANIPEETHFYMNRLAGTWENWTFFLMFAGFFFPFLALLSRHVKRSTNVLRGMAVYVLVMHYVDLYWLIMPNFNRQFDIESPACTFGLVDIALVVGFMGLFLFGVARHAGKQSLLATNDPLLGKCLGHKNL
ncbi:MAG: hypothetical protein H8E25_12455 [Planctomycetes bacterium]|nr:hypothetical protein [Planctomycetota bacterium]